MCLSISFSDVARSSIGARANNVGCDVFFFFFFSSLRSISAVSIYDVCVFFFRLQSAGTFCHDFDFAALDIFQIVRSPVAARFEALATVEVCELLACILTGDTDVESLLKLHQTCKILLFGKIVCLKDPDYDWI